MFIIRLIFCIIENVKPGLFPNLLISGFFQDLFVFNAFTLIIFSLNYLLKGRLNRAQKWIIFVFNNTILLLYIINLPVFHIFQVNINFRMISFLDEMKDLSGSINAIVSPYILIGSILIYIGISFYILKLSWKVRLIIKKKTAIIYLIITALLGFESEGIKIPDYRHNRNFRRNIFILIMNDTLTDIERKAYILKKQDIKFVQKFIHPDKEYYSSLFPFMYKQKTPLNRQVKRPNIVLIILESFRAKNIRGMSDDEYEVTPFFNSLIKKGIFFSHFYTAGIQTSKSMVSSMCSVLPYHGLKSIKYFPKTKYYGLGNYLKKLGYQDNLYIIGANVSYDKRTTFLKQIGFSRYIGLQNFKKNLPRFSWGIHDEAMFDRALKEMNKLKKPFYTCILTLSNHHPYNLPNKRFYKFRQLGYKGKYLAGMYYADWALSRFFSKIKKKAYFKNTVFLITSDNGESPFIEQQSTQLKKNLIEENIRVPFLIYAPGLNLKPKRMAILGSQVDILPTLCDITGYYPEKTHWVGKSLLQNYTNRWAFAQNAFGDSMIALMWKNYKLIYNFLYKDYELFKVDPLKVKEEKISLDSLSKEEREYYKKVLFTLYKVNNTAVIRNHIYQKTD